LFVNFEASDLVEDILVGIASMITAESWNTIQSATGCGGATVAKIAKRSKQAA
jgi:hypothetical protein